MDLYSQRGFTMFEDNFTMYFTICCVVNFLLVFSNVYKLAVTKFLLINRTTNTASVMQSGKIVLKSKFQTE